MAGLDHPIHDALVAYVEPVAGDVVVDLGSVRPVRRRRRLSRGASRGGGAWPRRVPLPEQFRVFVDDRGDLRCDHLCLRTAEILRLHYRLLPSASG